MNPNTRHIMSSEPFDPQVIDTFCFHWPDMHSYVLVRILDKTIAILPVRSRLAFLYFHHAPLPLCPSPTELRKTLPLPPKRMPYMFKNWKNTLVLDEPPLSPDNIPFTTKKTPSNVTLSNVMSYEPSLKTGWIHAPCAVSDDINMFDNVVVLTAKHTVLRLTCRCYAEKMMFMNLVKMKHHNVTHESPMNDSDNSEEEEEEEHVSVQLIDHVLEKNLTQIETLQELSLKINASKQSISTYTRQLLDLERSMDILSESTQTIQFRSMHRTLTHVDRQSKESIDCLCSYKDRIYDIHRRIVMHNVYFVHAKQRLIKITCRMNVNAWYPWLYTCKVQNVYTFFLYH